MPEYKKRRVNRLHGAPSPKKGRHAAASEPEEIKMSPAAKSRRQSAQKPPTRKKAEPDTGMRVVKGKKLERRRKTRVLLVAAAVLAAVGVILHLILPIGIYENLQNVLSLVGTGAYPTDFGGSDTLNTVSRGAYYYVLTDTTMNAYANSGKEIYSVAHGYENPIMKVSKTRALVFAQGGTEALIYNLAEQKNKITAESELVTAAISDSGVYALVTRSETYAAEVSVFDRHDNRIFNWFSAEDAVNELAISPNGKKIAVATFGGTAGSFHSAISIFNFDSATPEFTDRFEGSLVYRLDTTHNAGFTAVTANKLNFYTWSEHKKTEYTSDYTVSMFRAGSGGAAAVLHRESDPTDNHIAVFGTKGQLKSEFDFKGSLRDIEISGGHIYCISDTGVYLLGEDGGVIRQAECGFGAERLAVLGANSVAVITDNQISQITLEQQ